MYPLPIVAKTCHLLMSVGLLKYYEKVASLRENDHFLTQLIGHWDHGHQAFKVSPDLWYQQVIKIESFLALPNGSSPSQKYNL